MTTLYLIRHAEAEGNAYRRIDGWYNSLITPNGLLQIEALRRRFEPIQIGACYASNLYRTCKTASSVYAPKNLPLHTDPRLREVGLGRWENHPFGELEQFEPELLEQFNHDTIHWHVEGSETWQEFTARFEAALRDIAAANAGKTVAVFTHGSVLRAFQQRLLGSENVPYCDNTSVSRLTVEDGTFRIDFLNDASHLTPDISTFERQKWWREAGDRSDFNMWYRETAPGCFDALLHDTVVGHVSTQLSTPDTGEITALALEPAYRGRRLGEQLIGCAVCHLRAKGAKRLTVQLPPEHSARGFFRYFGFAEQGSDTLERSIKVPKFK